MNVRLILIITILAVGSSASPVWAKDESMQENTGMEMGGGVNHGAMPGMNNGKSSGMAMGRMQGGSAPDDARDPHAYSGGLDFAPMRPYLADESSFGSLLVDRLEVVRNSGDNMVVYDMQAWFGRDFNRAVLKLEGEYAAGEFEEVSTELLWGHAVATFWDLQFGLRHDSGAGPDQSWLALGFQGLAPYWFELDITAYLGEGGHSALGFEAEYELLFTQKLILQPRLEMTVNGKDNPKLAQGSGLSDMTAGLRLRYEIRREFAPYIGIERAVLFGDTKDYARIAGQTQSDTRFVAGMRFWF